MGDYVLGIDVSKWQGKMNFEIAKERGVKFVVIKANEYTKDSKFDEHYRAAKESGLLIGAYHYFHARDGIGQAEMFYDTVKDCEIDIPLAVDCEARDGIGSELVTSHLQAMLKKLEALMGRKPMIYTSWGWWHEYTLTWTGWKDYPLWVANWNTSTPYLPRSWSEWAFWQFSGGSNGRGAEFGASGSKSIDLDYFNGDYDALLKFCGKGKPVIVPPTEPPSSSLTLEQRLERLETLAVEHGWTLS